LIRPLIEDCLEVFGTLGLLGRVDQDLDQRWQKVPAVLSNKPKEDAPDPRHHVFRGTRLKMAL
jgi:hypothetical protein